MSQIESGLPSGVKLHEVFLSAVLLVSPLAIGTVHPPVVVAFSGLILVAFAAFLAGGGGAAFAGSSRFLHVALLAGCIVMVVQMLPLPGCLAGVLSPRAAEIADALARNLGVGGARAVSLDRAATAQELSRACACLMVFVLVAGSDPTARRRVFETLAIAGFAVTAIGLFQKLAAVRQILGFHPVPNPDARFFLATFVNTNHLAAFLGLSSCVSVGLAADAEARARRALFLFFGAVSGIGVFLSISRGGIVAFVAAQFLLAVLLAGRSGRSNARAAWVPVAAVVAVAVASWLAYDEIVKRFGAVGTLATIESDGKIRSFSGALKMVAAFWPVGAGRGAYQGAIDMFRLPGHTTWTHAENEYLQVAADMGLPFAVLLFSAYAIFAGAAVLRRRSGVESGALAGVYMLALHNFVDFNLETGAVSFAFFAACGALAGPAEAGTTGDPQGRRLLFGTLGLGAAALVLAILAMPHSLKNDTDRVGSALAKSGYGPNARIVKQAISLHRADYFLPLVAGGAIAREGTDPALALKFFTHAVTLNPVAYEPHLYAARLFMKAGRDGQAFAEYRQAIRLNVAAADGIFDEILAARPDPAGLPRAVPEGRPAMLALASYLLRRGRAADAAATLEDAEVLFPGDADIRLERARALMHSGRKSEALEIARRHVDAHPASPAGFRLVAAIRESMGDRAGALEAYMAAIARGRADAGLWLAVAHIHLVEGRYAESRRAVQGVFAIPELPLDDRAKAHLALGALAEAQGKPVEALSEHRRALGLMPGWGHVHVGMGRLYEKTGNVLKAVENYREALRINPRDEGALARLKELQKAQPPPAAP